MPVNFPSGDVRTAMIKMDNGRSRGMGTVSFYNSDDARRAVRILASFRSRHCLKVLIVMMGDRCYLLVQDLPCLAIQGGHSSGKPGKVMELKSGQGKVRENRN